MKYLITTFFALIFTYPVHAQTAEETRTINGIITALYEVISGPAGERDWDRFTGLFTDNAIMGSVGKNSEGVEVYRKMTPGSYAERNGPFFLENGFWETEIGRTVDRFGSVVHVFSAYQFVVGDDPDGEVARRGINSIQLIHEADRWWIASIQWTSETEDNPLPPNMTGK